MNGQINPNRQRPNRSRSAAVSLTLVALIAGSTMAENLDGQHKLAKSRLSF